MRAEDEETWREAYDTELQRNQLLREQLKIDGMDLPEVCEVDWKGSYEQLELSDGDRTRPKVLDGI